MKQEYPKHLYHREHGSRAVESAEEHAELGDEWKESPAEFADVEEIPGGVVSSEPAAAAEKPAKAAKKGKK